MVDGVKFNASFVDVVGARGSKVVNLDIIDMSLIILCRSLGEHKQNVDQVLPVCIRASINDAFPV